MKFKHFTSTLLLLAFLLNIVACTAVDDGQDVLNTAPSATVAPTEPENPDNLPQADYEGYEFKILSSTSDMKYYDTDSESGEIINDVLFRRNRTVEERFNVKITALHSIFGANLSLEGYLINLRNVPHLDFEKPWWFPLSVKELTFKDQMYLACNAMNYNALSIVSVMYINLALYKSYGLEEKYGSIYKTVTDGKWTLEAMTQMTKDVYSDLNGDGKRDKDDLYGYLSTPNDESLWVAFDVPILEKSEDI